MRQRELRLLRSALLCLMLSLSLFVSAGCVRGGTNSTPSSFDDTSSQIAEAALVDAFGELIGWVNQNKRSFDASAMPVCVVLGDSDDPSSGTVDLLRKQWRWVEPASKCPFQDRNVLIVAADVGEKLSDGRMLAHAGFSLGSHQGASWAYRLTPQGPEGKGWSIDARLESRSVLP